MLNGFFLNFVVNEIKSKLLNLYVDKVYHTSKEEVVIYFRSSSNYKLLLNINAGYARITLTNQKIENPSEATMFCMLLRKYLNNAKLINLYQYDLERLVVLEFLTSNDVGDKIIIKLVVEIMGKHSNIILVTKDDLIIDSIKRVDLNMSKIRQILPKIHYQLPQNCNKINILTNSIDNILDNFMLDDEIEIQNQLVKNFQGFSKLLAKEVVYLAKYNFDFDVNLGFKECLLKSLEELKNIVRNNLGKPYIFLNSKNQPKYFSFMPLKHLTDEGFKIKEADSYTELLEIFYAEKNNLDRITQNSKDMICKLMSLQKKLKNKLKIQKEEKLNCKDKDKLQQCAILLQSNLYKIQKGDDKVVLEDFFNDNHPVTIKLNTALSAAANAQKYFNKYKKMCMADKMLTDLIINTENEIEYIDSVIDNILRSDTRDNLELIKIELQEQGYLRKSKDNSIKRKLPKNKFLKIQSVDGFDILIGNNNVNNDILTFKHASKNDIWFHVQKIPGAHIIVLTNGRSVPITTIEQAATIAAEHSKAKDENLVSVDYTEVKNVKKFKGARPGMVIYDNFKTIIVRK